MTKAKIKALAILCDVPAEEIEEKLRALSVLTETDEKKIKVKVSFKVGYDEWLVFTQKQAKKDMLEDLQRIKNKYENPNLYPNEKDGMVENQVSVGDTLYSLFRKI